MFPLGRLVATPRALLALEHSGEDLAEFLRRHRAGDWGQIHPEDRGLNEEALRTGGRLMSVYRLRSGLTLWIVTEADRSATTALLPEEY